MSIVKILVLAIVVESTGSTIKSKSPNAAVPLNKVRHLMAPRARPTRFCENAKVKFPIRGIKDSPPYLHDGRLLSLEDTVEFFNLILGTRLTAGEK
jgi:hypothetical protein